MWGRGRATISYTAFAAERGSAELGSLIVRSSGPLGLLERACRGRPFSTRVEVLRALLLGKAGLLPRSAGDRAWRIWGREGDGEPMPASCWRLFRVRPENHPGWILDSWYVNWDRMPAGVTTMTFPVDQHFQALLLVYRELPPRDLRRRPQAEVVGRVGIPNQAQ